jgi:hypothetical protein
MEHTLVHELVHMYDQCTFKVDWNNLRHHACSEVRMMTVTLMFFLATNGNFESTPHDFFRSGPIV